MAELVVGGALLRVLQGLISLVQLLELLLGGFVAGIAVGMAVLGERRKADLMSCSLAPLEARGPRSSRAWPWQLRVSIGAAVAIAALASYAIPEPDDASASPITGDARRDPTMRGSLAGLHDKADHVPAICIPARTMPACGSSRAVPLSYRAAKRCQPIRPTSSCRP